MKKMVFGALMEEERETLKELSRHHEYPDARLRAKGLLALDKGHTVSEVAEALDMNRQTIRNWAAWWNEEGLVGILGGHKGGRPAKLTAELLETGKKRALEQPMTLAQIAAAIHEEHPEAPEFSLNRLSAGLRRGGLRFTRTRLSLKKSAAKPNSGRRKTP